jgi:hypothetical protein
VSKLREIFIILSFIGGATIREDSTKYPKTLMLINRLLTITLTLWIIANRN